MKDDFTGRLLEESLKQYSRVSPPEGFEARLKARLEAADRRPEAYRWRWLLVPAATAVALAVLWLRPAPAPGPPAPAIVRANLPPAPAVAARRVVTRHAVPRHAVLPASRPRFRILTAQELARMDLPAELFAPREEKPLRDLEIPEITIPPLQMEEEVKEK